MGTPIGHQKELIGIGRIGVPWPAGEISTLVAITYSALNGRGKDSSYGGDNQYYKSYSNLSQGDGKNTPKGDGKNKRSQKAKGKGEKTKLAAMRKRLLATTLYRAATPTLRYLRWSTRPKANIQVVEFVVDF